jgi:hypothetical protein
MRVMPTNITLVHTAFGCFAFALALYWFTLAPTFGWGDSADLAIRIVMDNDHTFTGGSRDYLLYRWVGGLFQWLPFGDVGACANAMSAFFGAVTVAIIAFMSGRLARSAYAACCAGIALTVSHSFWLMSVIAEVYTFNAALIFAAYAFMMCWWQTSNKWYLLGVAVFAGLALHHHATGLVVAATLAALGIVRIRQLSVGFIALLALVFLAVSFRYWQLASIHIMAGYPFMKSVGLQNPANLNYAVAPLHEAAKFLAYVAYNFLSPAMPLAVWGLLILWRKRRAEMLPPILWLGMLVGAGITSSIPDKFNIYVLVYPVLAIAVGIASAEAKKRFPKLAAVLLLSLVLLPPLGYVAAVKVAQRLEMDLVGARTIPYRENNWYFMVPSKRGDMGPRRYAEEALATVDKNAVLIADYSLWRPLYLLQAVEAVRPDVTLVWAEPLMWRGTMREYIERLPCAQPVYLATDTPADYYQLDALRKHYTITKIGLIVQVERECKR